MNVRREGSLQQQCKVKQNTGSEGRPMTVSPGTLPFGSGSRRSRRLPAWRKMESGAQWPAGKAGRRCRRCWGRCRGCSRRAAGSYVLHPTPVASRHSQQLASGTSHIPRYTCTSFSAGPQSKPHRIADLERACLIGGMIGQAQVPVAVLRIP